MAVKGHRPNAAATAAVQLAYGVLEGRAAPHTCPAFSPTSPLPMTCPPPPPQLVNASTPGPDAFIQPLNLTAEAFHDIAGEIASVFVNASQLLTPDSVRAELGAPADADLTALLVRPPGAGAGAGCPWPPLDQLRSKVAFLLMLDDAGAVQYTQLFPGLQGSPAWVTQTPVGGGGGCREGGLRRQHVVCQNRVR